MNTPSFTPETIAELRAAVEKMTPGLLRVGERCQHSDCDQTHVPVFWSDSGTCAHFHKEEDAAGYVMLRNHAKALIDAAEAIDRLRSRSVEDLMASLTALEKELAEAQRQQLRSEWIADNYATVGRAGYRGRDGWEVRIADPGGHYQEERTKVIGYGETLDEAIDKAMEVRHFPSRVTRLLAERDEARRVWATENLSHNVARAQRDEAQRKLALCRTALEGIEDIPPVPFVLDQQVMAARTIEAMRTLARTTLDQTKP